MQVALLNPLAILLIEVELAEVELAGRAGLRTSLAALVRRVLLEVA